MAARRAETRAAESRPPGRKRQVRSRHPGRRRRASRHASGAKTPGAQPAQAGASHGDADRRAGAKATQPGGKATPAAKPAGKPAAKRGQAGPGKPAAGAKPVPHAKKRRRRKQAAAAAARIGQVLVDLGFIDDDQLWEILDEAKNTGQPTGQVAVGRGLITEDQLLQALAEQHGLKVVNLEEVKPQPEALQLVPETMATVYKVLPLSLKDKVLTVVIGDPTNLAGAGRPAQPPRHQGGAGRAGHRRRPSTRPSPRLYAGKEESIIDIIQQLEADPSWAAGRQPETSIDLESLMEIQDAAPVRKLINMVMLLAIKDQASDIHFEPFEDEYKMRYRCDGVLYEMVPPPRHLAMAISSRIKVMSNLDIAERRLPQDGRIELNVGGNPVDMRVSVLPTMFGESVVIRVLDRTVVSLDLNKVGMDAGDAGRVPRADPQAQRHRPGHRADRLRQDDHALLRPQRAERDHRQDHHHRGPGRVRHRRHHPGADQRRDRPDVRRGPAGASCGRTRTRSWSARSATWKRRRSPCRRR